MVMDATLHRELGLTDDEAASIELILGRRPNHLELAMYAVMWSEHCSYKSSRLHLRRLPTEGPAVLVGPGENAGVVDAGDGIAVAHADRKPQPPVGHRALQGAATGVGGILRDIFTMGARPIALMDPLRFGPLDDARNRWVASGVVSGISGYGNAVGVPTVGGEIDVRRVLRGQSAGQRLVLRASCPRSASCSARAGGEGNLAVLLGSSTGRDGIGGVSVLASAAFGDDAEADAAKRPNVQVGDPFEEKRLIEACLELLDRRPRRRHPGPRRRRAHVRDQRDGRLGAASGWTSTSTPCPLREPGMAPFEVMTSESQERMLAIVTPAALERVLEVCGRWEVAGDGRRQGDRRRERAADPRRLGRRGAGRRAGGQPRTRTPPPTTARCHAGRSRRARRLTTRPAARAGRRTTGRATCWRCWSTRPGCSASTTTSCSSTPSSAPASRCRRAAPVGPGCPAAGRCAARAIALSTDGNPRWCALDPRAGTRLRRGRVRAQRRLCRRPAGRPRQLPELRQPRAPRGDVAALGGDRRHGRGVPGARHPRRRRQRQPLQREQGTDIDPTPVVGTLGLVDHLRPGTPTPRADRREPGGAARPRRPRRRFSGRLALGRASAGATAGGALPPSTWGCTPGCWAWWPTLVNERLVDGIHDVSDGGIGVALAEMAVKSGTGCRVSGSAGHAGAFRRRPVQGAPERAAGQPGFGQAKAAAAGTPVAEMGLPAVTVS